MASQAAGSQASSAMEQEARDSPPPDADIDWENTPVLSWMHPVFTGRSIIARGGHASALVGNLLITFGGHYFGKDKFMYCNDVWAIDLDTMTWHNPTCTGRAPGQRYGHTVTVVDYKVYIFGGRGPSGLLHNDLWCLDVETWKWTLMPSTTAPPLARFNHAGVAVGNKIAYFGGWDGESAFNDLWVYDIGELSGAERQGHVRGMLPKPRHGHSMVLTPEGRMIVQGGWAPTEQGFPQYLRDTRVFDTGSMMWIRPRISGDFPPPSFSHAAVMVGRFMVLLGGYGGHKPKPAAAAAEAALITTSADVWVLDTDAVDDDDEGGERKASIRPNKRSGDGTSDALSMKWMQPFIAGQPPGRRYGHSLVAVGPHVLALGGWDGNKAIGEVLQLDLTALVGPSLMMESQHGDGEVGQQHGGAEA
ncbi:GPA3, partial [Symbiodinium sp. KB8]